MQIVTSTRILSIARHVPLGGSVADIGAGDGELANLLAARGCYVTVIASEAKTGPFQRLAERCAPGVELRFGDGLRVLDPGEADTIVLAGMGSALMIDILSAGLEVAHACPRLILGPMGDPDDLRQFLYEKRLPPFTEDLVQEGRQFYHVMVCRYGEEPTPSLAEIILGRHLMRQRHPVMVSYLQSRLARAQRIAAAAGPRLPKEQQHQLDVLAEVAAGLQE